MTKKDSKDLLGILRAYSTADRVYALEPDKLESLLDILNKRLFKVSDTPLSYRQINYLDNNDILEDTREDKNAWRRFSLKELVFLSVLNELKLYGVKDTLLKKINRVFFDKNNKKMSDQALILPFTGVLITLVIKPDDIYFTDITTLALFEKKSRNYIKINISEILMGIWEQIGKTRIEYKTDYQIFGEVISDLYIGDKELEIIKLIRDGDYKQIVVQRKDKNYVVSKENESQDNLSPKQVYELFMDGDFTDIALTRRNGKIVNVKKSENIKI